MAGNEGLFKALQMFQNGVADLATQRAITQANEQVQQIKASELDEAKKRSQLHSLSNQLVTKLSSLGVPATTIALTAGAIQPSIDPITASENAAKAKIDEREDEQAHRKELTQMQLDAQARLNASKTQTKKLTDTQINAFADAKAQADGLRNLLVDVTKDPGLTGPVDANLPGRGKYYDANFGKFKMKSKQLFNQYRKVITGAGASTQEIKMLMDAWPTGDEADDVYREKVQAAIDVGNTIINGRIQALDSSGYDVTQLQDLMNGGAQTLNINTAPGTMNMSGGANKYIRKP